MATGDLASLAAVKSFRGILSYDDDGELARLITAASAFASLYCRRTFAEDVGLVEHHSTSVGQRRLLLRRPPISSITSLADDPQRIYGAATLLPATTYVIADAGVGLVLLDGASFSGGVNNVQVIYRGGYAVIPADLAQAVVELVWLAREKGASNLLGMRAKSIADGNVSVLNMDWPAHVTAILDAYTLPHGVV